MIGRPVKRLLGMWIVREGVLWDYDEDYGYDHEVDACYSVV